MLLVVKTVLLVLLTLLLVIPTMLLVVKTVLLVLLTLLLVVRTMLLVLMALLLVHNVLLQLALRSHQAAVFHESSKILSYNKKSLADRSSQPNTDDENARIFSSN